MTWTAPPTLSPAHPSKLHDSQLSLVSDPHSFAVRPTRAPSKQICRAVNQVRVRRSLPSQILRLNVNTAVASCLTLCAVLIDPPQSARQLLPLRSLQVQQHGHAHVHGVLEAGQAVHHELGVERGGGRGVGVVVALRGRGGTDTHGGIMQCILSCHGMAADEARKAYLMCTDGAGRKIDWPLHHCHSLLAFTIANHHCHSALLNDCLHMDPPTIARPQASLGFVARPLAVAAVPAVAPAKAGGCHHRGAVGGGNTCFNAWLLEG